ncbi:MAG: GTP cyclohydrolase II [Sphingomonadaceae bacterium]|uniref:GTP cyclohydrolase II n=1 Tax=Thermaurantiacus sp. TaxID=2820283 RepID=UPI00298F15CA|nr:GTP cyclohydrolase II [Thermaurantiacus sp.]MCS6987327.1 GTP cyclohydrolase II [Sphingomonadaceae bacterium]MDW8414548.1 GTP cyclohydrolase II [Thermaurantiacus sp.]
MSTADPTSDLALARAVDDLRRGEIVRVLDPPQALSVLAAELATPASLARLEAQGPVHLLLTPERAATLHLLNQRAAAGAEVVMVAPAPWLDVVACRSAADPATDLDHPLKGPFPTRSPGPWCRAAKAALALLKRARLLPAALAVEDRAPTPGRLEADAQAILAWRRVRRLAIVTRATLPLEGAEEAQVVAFRADDGGPEHLALIIGAPGPVPLVRLHSACLTGDVLGSLRCDCGPQLRAAVARLGREGGILLYLQQEGRGIGLLNKLRAYALQDQGFDTVDANERLGFAAEERDFDLAAAMLRLLGVDRVRLLTNNPAKPQALQQAGIAVEGVVPLVAPTNPHNARYLATKRDRQGHRL